MRTSTRVILSVGAALVLALAAPAIAAIFAFVYTGHTLIGGDQVGIGLFAGFIVGSVTLMIALATEGF